MKFTNKIAVITGAASGIGRATTRALIERDIGVVAAVDRNEIIHQLARETNDKYGREVAIPFVGDVTCDDFRRSVFKEIKERFGAVHICIPAAGITRDALAVRRNKETGQIETYSREQLEEVFKINLVAPILWAMDSVASLAEHRFGQGKKRWSPEEGMQGAIVFIGSVSSAGNKGQISYAAAKAGLEGAQATLSKEAIFYGVRCSIIHPGFTDTPMVRMLGDEYIEKNILPFTQLRRLLRPDEIADAICFMLTNSAVSGSVWVDAGWHPAAG
ncbi:MAG TPA: SDR family NAD(P)-dependent oxidoreductase [Phycisphaerae bacterium]|mgnify:CR=1 FL=1|nr:SDR family NAD(P)-dependent oxidoreductase [Phycisphaerae bacterium]HRW52364.1 SDR family NAD(P)-dependent oxidoreductase [Phycisphaerae bacterium]